MLTYGYPMRNLPPCECCKDRVTAKREIHTLAADFTAYLCRWCYTAIVLDELGWGLRCL